VDTAQSFSDGDATGTIGRHGSYKTEMLIVAAGTDAVKLEANLRQQGILLEGDLVVPGAPSS